MDSKYRITMRMAPIYSKASRIDLVHHGGSSLGGEFAHTLNMTNIATGWTEP